GKLYCVGYSVKSFYLNTYVISNLIGHKGEMISAEVIATFLPRSVVDSLYTVMNKVDLKVRNLTLEPIAAIEAAVPKNLRLLNIALVDIGAGTSDIAISSKETISSYGMVPMAGDEVTEVIAQEYLVDFNKAESIKRKIDECEEITYTDVLGLENTINSENIKKLIAPVVCKIAEAISKKILEINGDKSPSAVFLVGGGAHTFGILNEIAKGLNLPIQRIAIKDRTVVQECTCSNELGSAGVTVLGIALIALRSMGNDFIDVFLNDNPISLFNSHKHTIMDVLLQAGVNPSLLIGKNGKSLRFKINDKRRLVFGEVGKNAKITINKKKATLETMVNAKDKIKVIYARPGKDAAPKIMDQLDSIDSIGIYLDGKLVNLEPMAFVNGKQKKLTSLIKDGDNIEVEFPKNILSIKKYIINDDRCIYKNGVELEDDYILCDGDEITSQVTTIKETEVENIEAIETVEKNTEYSSKEKLGFKVIVNGEEKTLFDKESYMLVDVLSVMNIDLSTLKGQINLVLNGKSAAFTDELN
ncbi:MAG: cell division FtsA domain-containing protein, partial [Clostridium sp.]